MFDKKPETKQDAKPAEPKSYGSGNLTSIYYKIEVRTSYSQPKVVQTQDPKNPLVIDGEWREWPLSLRYGDGPAPSVPVREWDRHAAEHGLLSYEAAVAHQWSVFAMLDAGGWGGSLCVETRLVAVEFAESYSMTEKGVSAPLITPRRPWDDFKPRDNNVPFVTDDK